jgi:DNA-binding IclR family transcriptional regulator
MSDSADWALVVGGGSAVNGPVASDVRGTTRTLTRGLTLLELISEARDGATVTELAAGSELDKGTVSRLLATLRESGWAHQGADRRYRLAGKALALSHDYTNRVDLRALALPLLAKLRDQWEETVHLGQVEGDVVVYVERLEPSRPVRVVSIVGQRMPIACTAMGRAYLAALPIDEMRRMVNELSMVRLTPRTIVTRKRLLAELHTSALRGYAIDAQESSEDIVCVGSAVTDVTGRPVGAISISGPAYRMHAVVPQMGQACRMAALAISMALGAPEASGTALP